MRNVFRGSNYFTSLIAPTKRACFLFYLPCVWLREEYVSLSNYLRLPEVFTDITVCFLLLAVTCLIYFISHYFEKCANMLNSTDTIIAPRTLLHRVLVVVIKFNRRLFMFRNASSPPESLLTFSIGTV